MSSSFRWFSPKNLKAQREAAGLTRTQLAYKVGVAFTTVEGWEYGRATPRADSLGDLSLLFGCLIDDLFTEVRR